MKKRLTRYSFLLAIMAMSYLFGSYLVGFDHQSKYIWSDAEGYYMYLPAVFIYGGDFEQIPVRTKDHFKAYPGTSKIFTKYNYGVAFLQAPFYLSAYFTSSGLDSYAGARYSICLLWAASFYGVLGLYFLWKTLQGHFSSRWTSWLTLATILFGTNLLHYMTRAPGMSHVYSFFLVALLVYLSPGLLRAPTLGKFIFAGFVAGLMVLIRPTNGVVLLYPLLCGVKSLSGLTQRFIFLSNNWKKLLAAAAVAAALWVPQLWYWHYLSGHWFIDAYNTESFQFWDRPLVHYVLFSVLNGYFIYNPVMLLPVIALPFLWKKNQLNSWASIFIFVLSTYIFSSWWCWWFGGAYGARSYVELLPILALPMGFVLNVILKSKPKVLKISFLSLVFMLVFYNFRMIVLYEPSWSAMTWDWDKYWKALAEAFFI